MGGLCSKDDTKKKKNKKEDVGSADANGSQTGSPKAATGSRAGDALSQDTASYPSEAGGPPPAAADKATDNDAGSDQRTPSERAVAAGASLVKPTPNGREDLFTEGQDERMGIRPGLDKYADLTASEMASDDGKSWHSLDSMSSADLHTLHSKSTQATAMTGQSRGKAPPLPLAPSPAAALSGPILLADDEPTDATEVMSSAFLSPMDDDTRSVASAFSNAPHGYDFYNNDIPPTSSLARGAVPGATPSNTAAGLGASQRRDVTGTPSTTGGGGFTVTDVRRNTKADFQRTGSARSGISRTNEPFGGNHGDDDDDAASFYSCNTMATTAVSAAGAGRALPPRAVSPRQVPATAIPSARLRAPSTDSDPAGPVPAAAAPEEDEVASSQFQSLPPSEAYSTVAPTTKVASSRAAAQPATGRRPSASNPTTTSARSNGSREPFTAATKDSKPVASGRGGTSSNAALAKAATSPSTSARSTGKKTPSVASARKSPAAPASKSSSARGPSLASARPDAASGRGGAPGPDVVAVEDGESPAPASRPTARPDQLVSTPPADMDDADLYEDAVSEAMTFHTAVSYGTAYTGYGSPRPAAPRPVSSVAQVSPNSKAAAAVPTPVASSSRGATAPAPATESESESADSDVVYPVESEFTYVTARSAGGDATTVVASTYLPDPPSMAGGASAYNATPPPSQQQQQQPPFAAAPATAADHDLYEDAGEEENDDGVSALTFMTARSAGGATTITEANQTASPRKSSIVVLSGLQKPASSSSTAAVSAPVPAPQQEPPQEQQQPKKEQHVQWKEVPHASDLPEVSRPSVIKSRPERPSAIRRRERAGVTKAPPPAQVPQDADSEDEL